MDAIEKVLDKIKSIRKEQGLSHESMAHELGISQAAYTNLEKNESKLTVERFIAIAEILKKPTCEFFDGTPQNIYNQNQNTDIENKEILNKLLSSFEERIKTQQEEIDFLRSHFKQ